MKYIYVLRNEINGKLYVGITADMRQRWYSHRSNANHPEWKRKHHYLHNAINKYGEKNFVMFEWESFEDEKEALEAERFWIQFFRTWDKNYGYNLTFGGEGAWGYKHSEEHNKKISQSLLGNQNSTGSIRTDVWKKDMSIKHAGQRNAKVKITEQDVLDIRAFHSNNISDQSLDVFKYLGDKYNLSVSGLEKIIYRKTWKHI